MTKSINVTNISEKRSYSYIIWALVFFFLLLMRDVYSVGINKYIFLAISCVCVVSMKTKDIIYLFCFLFPLYVGLPGNYMTLVLIARLIFEINRFKASSFVISALIAAYVFVQNLITDYTGIVPMMFIGGVVVLLMLFTYKPNLEPLPMIVMYSAGVAALGIIMLWSTLNLYSLSDLMETSFRLGSANVSYVEEGIMNVSMDPNFYGTFVISAVSTSFPWIFKSETKPFVKICLGVFAALDIVVCLIGLSRAFVIVFAAWIVLYLLFQNNVKSAFIVLVAIILIVTLLLNLMPSVIETVLARFEDSDMATGNGRLTLIEEFFLEWSSGIIPLFFGVGLYNCNVHCMPLQFLFGGGVVLFALVVALFFSYKSTKISKTSLFDLLPFIVTFTMMCTVPAAGVFNFIFPLVLVCLSIRDSDENIEMRSIQ